MPQQSFFKKVLRQVNSMDDENGIEDIVTEIEETEAEDEGENE